MVKKLLLTILTLLLVLGLTNSVHGELSVGVKKGDLIEYQVTYTGNPVEGHDINWARMEILDVQDTKISVMITSRFSNGSIKELNSTLDLATGQLIDNFIIPSKLSAGDTFYAQNLGNVTISKAEKHEYAGAERTVLYASTNEDTYIWDQATGVTVEATSEASGYTLHSIVEDTNMWRPAESFSSLILYATLVTVVIAVVLLTATVLWNRKKKLS
jgi:hypothetical protein